MMATSAKQGALYNHFTRFVLSHNYFHERSKLSIQAKNENFYAWGSLCNFVLSSPFYVGSSTSWYITYLLPKILFLMQVALLVQY
jgi:hypothetical protein